MANFRQSKIALLSLVVSAAPAMAVYDPDQGGWTEIIQCPTSSWDVCPVYHPKFYWGGSGPNISYISPNDWWAYADPGVSSYDCGQWINGSVVGGATYEEGQASVPQGVDVTINTDWWDFTNIDFSTGCGHQSVSTYVWGWRYNGSSWMREFVTAHTRTTFVNDQGICLFQGAGNPDYTNPELEGLAFGPLTLNINNSPYAVLHTKSQATSHFGVGCGEFECFHRVRIRVGYMGGPGVNKGKFEFTPVTDELAVEGRSDNAITPDSFSVKPNKSRLKTKTQRPAVQKNFKK